LLGSIPNGIFCDEASAGYDAYSILETGRDRSGTFLPLFLKSFDKYDEAFYAYLIVPFIQIFGLNEFSTRLPAAVAGILTVVVLFYLARELFDEKIALTAALFLCVSPWHLHFSRMAFRAILLPLFFSLGLFFFLKSRSQKSLLLFSGISFGLSLFTYTAARVFVPLFLLGLCLLERKHLLEHARKAVLALIVFVFFLAPLGLFWISPEGMARINEIGMSKTGQAAVNYFSYFDPRFLFIKGDPVPRHNAENVGQLFWFELPLLLIAARYHREWKYRNILLLWILLYPLPGALSHPYHALRTIPGAPLFAMLSAFGLQRIWRASVNFRRIIATGGALIVISTVSFYFYEYFVRYPVWSSRWWQFEMRDSIKYADQSDYDCVVLSTAFSHTYIFPLFYTSHPPAAYLNSPVDSEETGVIGKFRIESITEDSKLDSRCLYIMPGVEINQFREKYRIKDVYQVRHPDGRIALKLIQAGSARNP